MRVQEAMGFLSESELNSITCSHLAPANEKRNQMLASQGDDNEGEEADNGEDEEEEDDDSATQPPVKRFKPNPTPAAKPLKAEWDEEEEEDLDAIYGEFGEDEDEDDFCTQPYGEEEKAKPEEESLSDLDDDEIDAMINDDSEVRINEMIWESMYSEWEKERQGAYSFHFPVSRISVSHK